MVEKIKKWLRHNVLDSSELVSFPPTVETVDYGGCTSAELARVFDLMYKAIRDGR